MTWQGWLQIAMFAALTTAVVKPLGGYIARNVDGGGRMQRAFAPVEHGLYRLAGIDPAEEQNWIDYALAMLWFHLVGIAALYALLRLQGLLPLNPQNMTAVSPDLALNTAVSFATNTSLAVLWRRVDTRLSGADGGDCRAVLPVRRDRGRRRNCFGARLHTPFVGNGRQFLG